MSQLKDFIENFVTDENLKKNYIRYLEHLESRQENKNRNRVRYSKEWEKFGQSNLSFSEKFDRIMGTIEAKISYMFKAPENSRNIYCTGFDKYRGLGPVRQKLK